MKLQSFKIYRDELSHKICTDLYIQLHQDAELNVILLRFINVIESGFYHHNDYDFGLIESFKLIYLDSNFYCALDPDSSTENISKHDQNYILSDAIVLFATE